MNYQTILKNLIDQKLEKFRLPNSDIPPQITKQVLKTEIEKYFNNQRSLDFIYSLAQYLFNEVAFTKPIDKNLFQAVHDIIVCNQKKLQSTNAKNNILNIYNKYLK